MNSATAELLRKLCPNVPGAWGSRTSSCPDEVLCTALTEGRACTALRSWPCPSTPGVTDTRRTAPHRGGRLPRPGVTRRSPPLRGSLESGESLICDGKGTPLRVITTAANVNDITQTLDLVDSVPPVAGRPGRPRSLPSVSPGPQGIRLPGGAASATEPPDPDRDLCQGRPGHRGMGGSATSSSRPSPRSTSSSASPCAEKRRLELPDIFLPLACCLACWRRLETAELRSRWRS